MAKIFRAVREIVQDMCDDHKAITGVELTPDMLDNTIVIKFYDDAGALSLLYSAVQQVANDSQPATASKEARIEHLRTRQMSTQIPAQKSHGQITFTVTKAVSIPANSTQVKRLSDGAIFVAIQAGSATGAGQVTLYFESADSGNDKNLDSSNQPFTLITPIDGVNPACTNASLFLDGRDLETSDEMLERIQAHDRDDNSGGNTVAYETWAKEASPEVVTAKCIPLVRGPDTVDVIITAGTADISAAVENGQSISRLPSAPLIAKVQTYVDSLNPVTDVVLVKAPTELPFNTTFRYSLYAETSANRSYVNSEITKAWQTYVLSARPADILAPTDFERIVDKRVGDLIYERSCDNFAGSSSKYTVPSATILSLGILTLTTM